MFKNLWFPEGFLSQPLWKPKEFKHFKHKMFKNLWFPERLFFQMFKNSMFLNSFFTEILKTQCFFNVFVWWFSLNLKVESLNSKAEDLLNNTFENHVISLRVWACP